MKKELSKDAQREKKEKEKQLSDISKAIAKLKIAKK